MHSQNTLPVQKSIKLPVYLLCQGFLFIYKGLIAYGRDVDDDKRLSRKHMTMINTLKSWASKETQRCFIFQLHSNLAFLSDVLLGGTTKDMSGLIKENRVFCDNVTTTKRKHQIKKELIFHNTNYYITLNQHA